MSETSHIPYIAMVEKAFDLSKAAKEFTKNAGKPVDHIDILENVFLPSGDVDLERTSKEGGNPLMKVFFTNPYGLEFKPDVGNWIPFRHGPINLDLD